MQINATPWQLYTRGRDRVPFVEEVRWSLGPIWTGTENLALTEIRSPDHLITFCHLILSSSLLTPFFLGGGRINVLFFSVLEYLQSVFS